MLTKVEQPLGEENVPQQGAEGSHQRQFTDPRFPGPRTRKENKYLYVDFTVAKLYLLHHCVGT